MSALQFDKIIIGAGLYGLYSALFCCKKGQKVIVLECDDAPFKRATYINQARVHQGYHYPRSISTALKSAGYFERFNKDYAFCVNKEFDQIYATSTQSSWSDGVFRTREYTYDAMILKSIILMNSVLKTNKYRQLWYNQGRCSVKKQ